MPSPVRELFRKLDLSKVYSFAGGYPDSQTFPMEQLKELCAKVLDKYGAVSLQYGATLGVPLLREAIAARYGVECEKVQITTSSQQGIDICCRILLDPGDIVLVNNPSYLGALQSFASYRANVVDVSAATEDELKRAKMMYLVPDFQNPSGETMSLEGRKALVDMARRFGFVIVEDSPYRELRYDGTTVQSIYSLAPDVTLHLGSFSKVFAPGMRLGWIIGRTELLEKIALCKQSLDLCPPNFNQYLAAEFMLSGELDANLKKSIALYRRKRDYMLSLLEKYMPAGVKWTHPEGGLFIFLSLPDSCDSVAMYDRALAAGVTYVSGSFFYSDGSHRNTMRLNFSFIEESRMEDGVRVLSDVIKETI